ncbi:LNS2 (Lipin/Ned1/Smp2) [Vibrio aerogenes CECT 7868]|uniref:LNS2 (Lipin/Ned1/Smp2) n=1 Tax=Vibrio aerogenes CECT 7868 TaxID=1216006 RepID=A0A1M6CYA2_9VIBR|nr:haloacid dehalogenase [Vibrio aerogenes]SHI65698.1 LNS2 (Lipin/Ned1/Smp2) [Vibrio aerogenes CECT 7868]
MQRLWLVVVSVCALVVCSSAYSAVCPDLSPVNHSPQEPAPEKVQFDHIKNRLLSKFYTPYHMAHDVLVSEGDTAVMVGKFDYDFALHKDLEDESIHAYIFGTGMSDWEYLGDYTTDSDGKIYVNLGRRPAGDYRVYMVVAGDLSSTTGYLSVVQENEKAVLFDIDGTLTQSDSEAVGDYLGFSKAKAYAGAADMVKAYQAKNYRIIYLTARPYWLAKGSRSWLTAEGLPVFHMHLDANGELLEPTGKADYKAGYIKQLISHGVDIIRVYGNATTDIEAYELAGIPKAETYIIGKHAGESGTQPIPDDYLSHISDVVNSTPNAQCRSL